MSDNILTRLRIGGRLGEALVLVLGRDIPLDRTSAIRCLNPGAHRNGDAHPSAVVKPDAGRVDCAVCGGKWGLLAAAVATGYAATRAEAARKLETLFGNGHGSREEGGRSKKPPLSAQERRERLDEYLQNLTPDVIARICSTFRISEPTVHKLKLGWKTYPKGDRPSRVVVPAFSGDDVLTMKLRLLEPVEGEDKSLTHYRCDGVYVFGRDFIDKWPEKPVWWAAGEKDWVRSIEEVYVRAESVPAALVSSTGGEHREPADLGGWAPERHHVVFVDQDGGIGLKKARELGGRLRALGAASVKLVDLSFPEGEGPQKDLFDYWERGGTIEDLLAQVESAPAYDMPERLVAALSARPAGLAEIEYSTPAGDVPLHVVTTAALDALAARCIEIVYSRGGALVRTLRIDPGEHPEGRIGRGDSLRIAELPDAALRERLSESARWTISRVKDGEVVRVEKWPPKPVLEAVRDRGEWPMLRSLLAVIEAPTLRPDGSILQIAGYDAATGLLLVPRGPYPNIAESPSEAEVQEALRVLTRPFDEFMLATMADWASLIALMLTIAGRPAIPGPVPHWAITAPSYGSGKTLLGETATISMTGAEPDTLAPIGGRRDEGEAEMRKVITTLVREAPRVVIVDNVPDGGTLRSGALAKALTSSTWTDRLLSTNDSIRLPHRIVWMSTGCNYSVWGDLARRSLSIVIDPGVEHPEKRTFRIRDLAGHVRREHPHLLGAALVVLRGFVAAGRPGHGKPPLGKFEAWDTLIRAAVIWAMGIDPLDTQLRLQEEAPDKNGLRELLHAWRDAFGGEGATAKEAVERAKTDESLREAIASLGGTKDGEPDARSLGNRIRAKARTVADGLRFERIDTRHQAAVWAVRSVEGSPARSDSPLPRPKGESGESGSGDPARENQAVRESENKTGRGRQLTPQTPQTPLESREPEHREVGR